MDDAHHKKGSSNNSPFPFSDRISEILSLFIIISFILLEGSGDALFDHIAECLADFVHSREIQNEVLPLGFTFSFPCEQEGLAKAKLVQWTKGFSCSGNLDLLLKVEKLYTSFLGVEGEDVVILLQKAIERRGDVKIEVCAILNDTTGCLMSSAWRDDRCRVGLILGTGTNACYLEEIQDIHTINRDEFTGQKHMVINTEWGAFGDKGELDFIRTKWDYNVDKFSVNPGKQIFEKMISGMYMGELIRQVLVDLMKDDLIFYDCNRDKLAQRGKKTDLFYSRLNLFLEFSNFAILKINHPICPTLPIKCNEKVLGFQSLRNCTLTPSPTFSRAKKLYQTLVAGVHFFSNRGSPF